MLLPDTALIVRPQKQQRLTQGVWTRAGHERRFGRALNATAFDSIRTWAISPRFASALRQQAHANPELDIYAFGVYLGGSMRDIVRELGGRNFHWFYGFDVRSLPLVNRQLCFAPLTHLDVSRDVRSPSPACRTRRKLCSSLHYCRPLSSRFVSGDVHQNVTQTGQAPRRYGRPRLLYFYLL